MPILQSLALVGVDLEGNAKSGILWMA